MKGSVFLALAVGFVVLPAQVALGQETFPADAFGAKVEVHPDGAVSFAYDFEDPGELKDWEGVMKGREGADLAWVKDGALEVRESSKEFGFVYLKMPFTGDLTIEARARVNPPRKRELLFHLFGPDEDRGYGVGLAYPMEGAMGSYLLKRPNEVLKTVKKPKLDPGKWYDVRITVKGKAIAVYLKNRLILRVSDKDFREGRVGFGTFNSHVSFDSIRIRGTVDGSWLEEYTASKASAAAGAGLEVPGEADLLDGLSDEAREKIRKGKKWYSFGNFAAAAREFKAAAESDVSNPLPQYYLGRALMAQDLAGEAGEAFRRVVALREDLPWAHLWKARARRMEEGAGPREAVEDLHRAIRADGRYVEAFRELAIVYFLCGNFDGAVASSQKATRLLDAMSKEASGDKARALAEERDRAAVERDRFAWARDGLPLSPLNRGKSTLGEVRSDGSRDDVRDLARWLSALSGGFRMIMGWAGGEEVTVYVVRNRSLWENHRIPGVTLVKPGLGTLNPVTGQIVLDHEAGREAWKKGVAALCTRLLARKAGAAPWVEEGLGLYFEAIPSGGGSRLRTGLSHPKAARRAKAAVASGDFTQIWKLVVLERNEFDVKKDLHGAESWSLVHFHLHASKGAPDFFTSYFRRLKEGKKSREAMGEIDLKEMESAWKEHVRRLSD